MKRILLTLSFLLSTYLKLSAYDFKVDGIAYRILSDTTVEVASGGDYDDALKTNIIIPDAVCHFGFDYSVIRIGDNAFKGCSKNLKSVVIPEGVTSIGHDAFYDCYKMESVSLPSTLTKIDYRAFMYNFNLNNIVIPGSVKEIGFYAFYGERNNLTNITLSEGLLIIGDWAFGQCNMLKYLEIPSSVVSIGNDIFESTSIDSIVYNGKLEQIGTRAFPAKVSFIELPLQDNISVIPEHAFDGCVGMRNVVIPTSVTSIGAYAFANCTLIDSVYIPESVSSIGDCAFENCSQLRKINIPNSISYLGNNLFNNCINLGTTLIDNVLYYGDIILEVVDKNITECFIKEGTKYFGNAFQNCRNLKSITIPQSIIAIEDDAFIGCRSLPSIDGIRYADTYLIGVTDKSKKSYTIKEGTRWIAKNAFEGCNLLTSIIIPNSVSSIGPSAFLDCSSLSSLYLSKGITKIEEKTFYNCSSLASITIPEGVTNIGDDAFMGCKSLASIVLPEGITSMGNRAFYNCSSIKTIVLPEGVDSLGTSVFYGCSSLESIIIPSTLNVIGYDELNPSFGLCNNLKEVIINSPIIADDFYHVFRDGYREGYYRQYYDNGSYYDYYDLWRDSKPYLFIRGDIKPTHVIFPEGTTQIVDNTFSGINEMEFFAIPSTVRSIGNSAFQGCSSLTSLMIPDDVTSIGNSAFQGCSSLTSLIIPDDVRSIGNSAFQGCSSLTSLTIPDGITNIGGSAFENCISLESLVISEGIKNIGNRAFYNCSSIKTFVIPEGVDSLGASVFYGCSSLESITIPSTLTYIGYDMWNPSFGLCSNLQHVIIKSPIIAENYYHCFHEGYNNAYYTVLDGDGGYMSRYDTWEDGLPYSYVWRFVQPTTIIFPEGTTTICDKAFMGYEKMESFAIPSTVKSIGSSAFRGCSSLLSLSIPEGVTSIGGSAFRECSSLLSMILPEGLDSLGTSVFYGCSSLESITIPSTLHSIGYEEFCPSFGRCYNLKQVIIKSPIIADNFYHVFREGRVLGYYSDNLYDMYASYSLDDASGFGPASYNWRYVKPSHIEFPEGTSLIGSNAFSDCDEMKSFIIPSTVKSIGTNAFNNCTALTTLVIPESVDSIGQNALTNIDCYFDSDIPAKLESENLLGELGVAIVSPRDFETYRQAKYWHDFMAKIVRSDQMTRSVTTIASASASGLHVAVGEENLNSVFNLTVKGTVNGMDLLVIRNKMKNLRNLDMSEANIVANDDLFDYYQGGVIMADNELGNNAFKDMNIKSIILPKSLVSIGDYAFNNCVRLQSVYIDDNVKFIGRYAFNGCGKLADIHLGSNVREIKERAFVGCVFDTIVFGDSLQYIGSYSFSNSNLKSVEFKDALVSIGYNAFRDSRNLKNVLLGDGIITLEGEAFRGCTSLETLCLGSHLTDIGYNAFYDCYNLKSVNIPNSVTRIGSSAFRYCNSIDTLVIGHKVEYIDESAFYGCSGIENVTFGKSIKEIGRYAFEGCINIKSIMLPTSLKYIRYRAFADCTGLKEFKIPSSVEKIENEAFDGNRKLDAVYAYTIEPISIEQNTFSCWEFATLYVPKTSYYTYYLNKQWSQFMTLREFDEPYEYFYLNDDYLLDTITGRIDGVPDMLLNENSAIIVEGDETQEIAEIELMHNGTDGASIIGGKNDFTGKVENLTAKSMKVNIGVDGNRWYFFCFPFDVMHDSIECSAEYVIQTYDGAKRAEKGTGWVKLESDFTSLQKGQGYIFQTSRAGVLTIHVSAEYLTFTASNEKEILHTYASNDVSNASWNFIGNPFISYYDVQDLAKEYDAPIIVWNGKGYDVYKPGDDDYMLKPFETFFVQRIDGVQYVELLPENKLTYNQATTRSSLRASMRAAVGTPMNLDRQLVNIMLMGQDSITDRTRIVYSVNASMDYEIGVDAAKFHADGVPQLYTLNGKTKYAINERPMGTDEIKLGYTAPKAGTYTLSVPRHDAEIEIYDNVAKSKVDFTFGDYSFQSQAGTFNDRFVVYKTGGGVNKVDNGFRLDGMTVKTIDGGIVIEGNLTGKVQVYSDSGMLLAEPRQAGRVELGDGVYIIKMGDKSVKMSVN